MGLKKQYLKAGRVCKVTFSLARESVDSTSTVHLVGDFNNWNESAIPMKKLKNGTFTVTIALERNREYQFRYLLDGQRWENDWKADKYVGNDYGSENSVVIV